MARLPESCGELPILEDPGDRLGEGGRIPRWDEQSRYSVLDRLGQASDLGGHDRHGGGHGFEHRVGEALAERWEDRRGDLGEQLGDVQPEPREHHAPLKAEATQVAL